MPGKRDRKLVLTVALLGAALLVGSLLWWPSAREGFEPPVPDDPAAAPVSDREVAGLPGEDAPGKGASARTAADRQVRDPWKVTVLGPGDRPLKGIRIHRRNDVKSFVLTGPDGTATLPWEPVDDTLIVSISGPVPESTRHLRERETVLRYPDLLPLEAVVVDGLTGRPLWYAGVRLDRHYGESVPLIAERERHRLEVSPLRKGQYATLRFEVTPPEGYAPWDRKTTTLMGHISRFAEKVVARLVVWPEARVVVSILEHDGSPARDVFVSSARLGGKSHDTRCDPEGDDVAIHGIPHLKGERLSVRARSKDGRLTPTEYAVLGDWGTETRLTLRLPKPTPSSSVNSVIGIGGGAGGAFGRKGSRAVLKSGKASLAVHVWRRDGRPAADVRVVLAAAAKSRVHYPSGRTDAWGVARFRNLPEGVVRAMVQEVGFLSGGGKEVELRDGETAKVTIREAPGRTLFLSVFDEEGMPVPHALVTVKVPRGQPYTLVVDDVQQLGIYTSADGRCALPNLPSGEVQVTATFGTRKVTGKITDGAWLDLVLR